MSNSNSRPDNNMTWAILSTLFCCLPLGIAAIVNASKVEGLWRGGEHEAANEAAANAKKYAKWGTIAGVVMYAICIILEIALVLGSSRGNYASDDNSARYVSSLVSDDDEYSTEDLLKAIEDDVRDSNRDCPEEIEEGMTMTSIRMTGGHIVYRIECDEDIYSVSSLKSNKNTLKKEILKEVRGNANFVNLLKRCGVGLMYKYVGQTSGDVCIVTLEASEL